MAKYVVHRTDANAEAILRALEQVGCSVYRGGPLDAIVAKGGQTWLVEIKTARGKLRASQRAFIARWRGQVFLVRSVDDALAAIGVKPFPIGGDA